jgi:hypothetical protein
MNARIFLSITFAAFAPLAALAAGGCDTTHAAAPRNGSAATAPASKPSTRPATQPINPPSTQMTTLTGTLRGGMMAIGGETTGWSLVGDGAVGGVELDISRIKEDAKKLEGKRVTVSGHMVDKKYVERGTVRIMRVEKIQSAGQ